MPAHIDSIRSEIRRILREEIHALGLAGNPPAHRVEPVRLDSNADVLQFARAILARAGDTDFVAAVQAGQMQFVLQRTTAVQSAAIPAASPASAAMPWSGKNLLTEKDIAHVPQGQRVLRLSRNCRLTPLAQDEARRRGIKLERSTP